MMRRFLDSIRGVNLGSRTWRMIAISGLIGIVSGAAALAFYHALEWGSWYCLGWLAGYPQPAPAGEGLGQMATQGGYRPWLIVLLPTLGGLISGLLVYGFAPEAEGHGVDAMIDAFHQKAGFIRGRVPIIKSLASLVTLSTGGSAGREGPIAQIGAGFGSLVARLLKLNSRERRVFLLAGCAAGLGAIFRAPLGATLTSIEVLYSEDFESEAIIPCVISSVIAYSLFMVFQGTDPIFATPGFSFRDPRELLVYAFLGVACSPLSSLYVRVFYALRDRFRSLPVPRVFRPALGGLAVGLIGLALPQVLSGGFGWLQLAINGEMAVWVMLLAAVAKIAATGLTIGSGGSGGVFGPTLFIGGMFGGVVGYAGHWLWPHIVTQPGGYVLVGMAAFFAGAAKAPLGALIMIMEMTRSYGLLPPLMLVSVGAIVFSRGPSIYEKQLKNKFSSPAHTSERTMNILAELTVGQVFRPDPNFRVLRQDTTFAAIQEIIPGTRQTVFPVVDGEDNLVGLLPLKNIREVLFEDTLSNVVVAGELCTRPLFLTSDQDLYSALNTFLQAGVGQVPVVEVSSTGQAVILGMLNHDDLITAYQREVKQRLSGQ